MSSIDKAVVVKLNDAPEYQRIIAGPPETGGMKAGRVYLEPGKACGEHSTHEKEEILVFLTGTGQLLIGQEPEVLEVGKGMVAFIRPDTIHDVRNTGSEPLTYVFCVSPAAE
ncbi:MAG: cupin domain-containing protein [Sedimentisphaerales bacterium]|nr:cupin domain-containing protein [Sedimentisphaerales bacterium]